MSEYKSEILAFCAGFTGQFPGFRCEHSPGAGFDRNCQGFLVFEGARRLGALLLTDDLLDDVPVAEILVRLARACLLECLGKDKPVVFGNRGFIQ